MELAIGAPDRLQGVVAISPIVYPEIRLEHVLYGPRAFPGIGEWIGYGPGRMMDSLLLPSLWHAIFSPQPMPPRFAQYFPFSLASGPQQMIALGEEGVLSFPDLSALASRYHACKVAVMVIAGAADWLAPPWTHAARLSGAVPGAQLRLLAGMGHMLHHFADEEIALAIRRVSAANKTSPRTAA
jgi:pimeloyl-ACP methyl ester carboxylesterase